MHRAIAPAVMMPSVHKATPVIEFLGGFTVMRNSDWSYTTASGNTTISWNEIVWDSGFSLSTPVTTVTAPSGALYCLATVSARRDTIGADFYEGGFWLNGSTIKVRNTNDNGDYNKFHTTHLFPITDTDTVAAWFNANADTALSSGSWFSARFYK